MTFTRVYQIYILHKPAFRFIMPMGMLPARHWVIGESYIVIGNHVDLNQLSINGKKLVLMHSESTHVHLSPARNLCRLIKGTEGSVALFTHLCISTAD